MDLTTLVFLFIAHSVRDVSSLIGGEAVPALSVAQGQVVRFKTWPTNQWLCGGGIYGDEKAKVFTSSSCANNIMNSMSDSVDVRAYDIAGNYRSVSELDSTAGHWALLTLSSGFKTGFPTGGLAEDAVIEAGTSCTVYGVGPGDEIHYRELNTCQTRGSGLLTCDCCAEFGLNQPSDDGFPIVCAGLHEGAVMADTTYATKRQIE